MQEILTYLAGAVPATMFMVALAKKAVRRLWPKLKLDPTAVLVITAMANLGVAFAHFGRTYDWTTLALAAVAAAYGAKFGYDASRSLQEAHTPPPQ